MINTPSTSTETVSEKRGALRARLHFIWRWCKLFWSHSVAILFRADEDHVFLLAAGIAFNIIIALVPTLLILLFVLGYVFDSERILGQINEYVSTLVVAQGSRNDLTRILQTQITSLIANRGLAGVLGIGGLLWTGSALATSIRSAVNKVLRCSEVKHYLIYKLYDISTIAIIGLLIFASITMATLYQVIIDHAPSLATLLHLPAIEGALPEIISTATAILLFYIIFRYMPYQDQERHIIWIGTVASTVLWEIARLVFRFYLVEFTTFTRVYGAYAFIASAVFWLYYTALVFLLGAEVAYHVKQSRWNARRLFEKIATGGRVG